MGLLIGHGSLERLKLGLGVALVLSIVMGVMRWRRGVILWVGLTFFSLASVMVIVFQDMWTVNSPAFLRTNMVIATAWAVAFTASAGLAWLKMGETGDGLIYELVSYALLLGVAAFTQAYPALLRRRAAA